ncbi:MAG: hypothetical protein JKX99_06485 [Robiginitomaculum sp.]|nr:hypothetical protein [Robiginitomaculum sp.]
MTIKQSDNQNAQSKIPFALVLVACAGLGFVLTQVRDGFAEDVAWVAIAVSIGGLFGLFWRSRR